MNKELALEIIELLSALESVGVIESNKKVNDCAKRAYAQADAMLKERERGE